MRMSKKNMRELVEKKQIKRDITMNRDEKK